MAAFADASPPARTVAADAAAATPSVAHHDDVVEAMLGRVLAEVEAKLKRKEDGLWRRGQVEIKRLEQEHQEVKQHLAEVLIRQDRLQAENQALQQAVTDLTAQLQLVLKDARAALKCRPQGQGDALPSTPSLASTAASLGAPLGETQVTIQPTPGAASSEPWSAERPAAAEPSDGEGLRTPPRSEHAGGYGAASAVAAATPAVLSLASALPAGASPAATPGAAARAALSSTSLKRLVLADCIEDSPARPSGFVVSIAKDGLEELGLEVADTDEGVLRVDAIDGHGMVARHNRLQPSDATRILVGDLITEVNGVGQNTDDMLQQCKAPVVAFTLSRGGGVETPSGTVGITPSRLRPEAQEFVPGKEGGDEAVVKRLFD